MFIIANSRHCMHSSILSPWLCHWFSERGWLQSENYQLPTLLRLQGWSVKVAQGACSTTSALAFQMSVTASSFVCLGLILKQRQCCSIALRLPSSARRCTLRAVPKDMVLSHKWTCAFSMTISKILLSHEQCVRISRFLKVERSARDWLRVGTVPQRNRL